MSKKYIYEEKVVGDKTLQDSFIEVINKWANSIPHHPYRNLGNKIEITDIWYKPAYPIQVRSQFESRSKDKDFEPYTNQTIPERKYYALSDFNAWDFSYKQIKNFTNDVTKYYVDGSQYVENCFKCSGNGWITCVTCHGHQKITCPSCHGHGDVRCSSCNGSGREHCSSCGGHGYHNRYITRTKKVWVYNDDYERGGYYRDESYTDTVRETCTRCGGSGKVNCHNCGGSGRVTCRKCSGRGKITCPTCSGTGRNTCPTCKGHKRLMHHFYVERNLHYSNSQSCVIHSEVYDRFPQFLEEYNSYESYNIHSNREHRLDLNQLPEGNHLNSFINKFIEKAHPKATDTNSLKFQQLDVKCIDTWELHYKFKGSPYVMVFHGSSYEIIPGLSPIYEIAFRYWKSGVSAAKFYFYDQSRKLLTKASAMNNFEISDQVNASLANVKAKMAEPLELGARMTAYILAFFGGFLVYNYFNQVNFVFRYVDFINNPDNFLYPYQAWALTLTYVSLCFGAATTVKSLLKKLSAYIPFALTRFVLGVVGTSLFAVIYLGLLAAANAVGLGVVLAFILWGIVKLLRLLIILIYLFVKVVVWGAKLIWKLVLWIWNLIF